METVFKKMVEMVMANNRLCEACMFEREGCPGLTIGRCSEPVFPPCFDDLPKEGFVDPKILQAVYEEIVEEME